MAHGQYQAKRYTYRYAFSYVILLPYAILKTAQHFTYSAILLPISALMFFDDVITAGNADIRCLLAPLLYAFEFF